MRVTVVLSLILSLFAVTVGAQGGYWGTVTWDGIGPVQGMSISVYDGLGPIPRLVGSTTTNANGSFFIGGGVVSYGTINGSLAVPGIGNSRFFGGLGFQGIVGPGGGDYSQRISRLAVFVPDLHDDGSRLTLAIQRPWSFIPTNLEPYRVIDLGPSLTRSHADNAKLLDAEIDKTRAGILKTLNLPPQPIELDLIGVGSGGLTARTYVANHSGRTGENKVRKCVTIATPHLGMVWTTLLPLNHPILTANKNLAQMRFDYMMLLFASQLRGGYGATRFYLVGSSQNLNPHEPEVIPGWPYDSNDDGFVSTFSATDRSWGGTVAATATTQSTHWTAPNDAMKQVITWLRQP